MRALAEAFFPGLYQDAEMAQSANQEAIAIFFVTSASKMDFVIAAVSSWLLSWPRICCSRPCCMSGMRPARTLKNS